MQVQSSLRGDEQQLFTKVFKFKAVWSRDKAARTDLCWCPACGPSSHILFYWRSWGSSMPISASSRWHHQHLGSRGTCFPKCTTWPKQKKGQCEISSLYGLFNAESLFIRLCMYASMYLSMHIYASMYVSLHVSIYLSVSSYSMHASMYVSIYVSMYVAILSVSLYVSMDASSYVSMYLYASSYSVYASMGG